MSLKHRLVGAAVIVAGLVIFVPMLVDGGNKAGKSDKRITMEMKLPPAPKYSFDQAPLPNPDKEFNFRPSERTVEEDTPPPVPAVEAKAEPVRIVPPRRSNVVAPINPPTPAHPAMAQQVQARAAASITRTATSKPTAAPAKAMATDTAAKPVVSAKPVVGAKPVVSAKPQAAAESPAKPAAPGGYVVQVGGFGDINNAQQLRDRLVKDGFAAYVDSSKPGGKIPHKVKVGPEPDRAQAEALRGRLATQEHIQGFVTAQP